MIKLPRPQNLFGDDEPPPRRKSSFYEMTDYGKLFIGATLVEAAMEAAAQHSRPHPTPQYVGPNPVEEMNQILQQTLDFMRNHQDPNVYQNFCNLRKEEKQQRLIEIFCKLGRPDLVDTLEELVFPRLK